MDVHVGQVLLLYNLQLFIRGYFFLPPWWITIKSRFGEICFAINGSNQLEQNSDNASVQIYSHVLIVNDWQPTDGA